MIGVSMKKKYTKWIVLALIAVPVIYKFITIGIGEINKSNLKDEDKTIYKVGETIKNDVFQLTLDKIVVSKTPEDIAGLKEYFEDNEKYINFNKQAGKDIPIEISDDGVLENDVSYLKVYSTGENISDEPEVVVSLGNSLIGGGKPITATVLFSDKISGKDMVFNGHGFKKGEKKNVVISFVVWDKDLDQFKDSLYWSIDFPRGKAEKEPLARAVKIDLE